MRRGETRPLTAAERQALSPGLPEALDAAGCVPILVAEAHPAARIAALWRGGVPVMARPQRIFWPGALDDFSRGEGGRMASLQHELQHILDYATGAMTGLGYLARPRNWTYRYVLDDRSAWADFGAEQRASIAEHYWLMQRGRADLVERALGRRPARRDEYRRVIPWAAP